MGKDSIIQHSLTEYECPIHGRFTTSRRSFRQSKHGCPRCARESTFISVDDRINRWNMAHNTKYDYSLVPTSRVTSNTKIQIRCPQHGVFQQLAKDHERHGCPTCAATSRLNKVQTSGFRLKSKIEHINDCEAIHGSTYNYSKLPDDCQSVDRVTIICKKHGAFSQRLNDHKNGCGCPRCAIEGAQSKQEQEVSTFLKQLNMLVDTSQRNIIPPQEVDIVLPNHKIAIEFNGLYWHSELAGKGRSYHLNKQQKIENVGYHLITIYDHEWKTKRNIVQSRLKSIIGQNRRIFARACSVEDLDCSTADEFVEQTHIQGKRPTKYNYGLYDNGSLVAVMTFSASHEIIRYCSSLNVNVIGGAGKLLAHHIKSTSPRTITTFADRRWSTGNLYRALGFTFVHNTPPNYWYFTNGTGPLLSRLSFQKHKLPTVLPNVDMSLTEWDNMKNNGYNRIWDCGSSKWIKQI